MKSHEFDSASEIIENAERFRWILNPDSCSKGHMPTIIERSFNRDSRNNTPCINKKSQVYLAYSDEKDDHTPFSMSFDQSHADQFEYEDNRILFESIGTRNTHGQDFNSPQLISNIEQMDEDC